MTLLDAALSILGVLVGGLITWLVLRTRQEKAYQTGLREGSADTEKLRERVNQLDQQLQDTKQERDEIQVERDQANTEKARLETKNENLREKLADHKEEVENLQKQFSDRFENLANDILDKKSAKFTKQNEENIEQLLEPLQEKIETFQQKVEDTHKEDLKERATLKEKIQQLSELNQEMTTQAQDLVQALEGQSKTQGDWGEMILERLLEESGLTKGREYLVQESMETEDGNQVRPDVVVRLPDERHIVIDSKVSILAYRRFVSAENDDERNEQLKKHVASVRSHVKNLSSKNYHQLHEGGSPDFVLLFVPVEPAFAKALQESDGLYNEAFNQNVVIVSPTTLLATLATISNIWKQEYQNQNAQEIAKRGGRLYDKFCLFAEALEDVGKRIQQTQDSYSTAMNRLQDGQGNLVRQAEMLRELGADTSKQLPGSVAPAVNGELAPDEE
jgi:DNA recombination protein RmuC